MVPLYVRPTRFITSLQRRATESPSILSPLWWVGIRELIKPYEHQHEQPASWPDFSLLRKPPHVSNHQGPSWTVPACQCTAQNAKPGKGLPVADMKWQTNEKFSDPAHPSRRDYVIVIINQMSWLVVEGVVCLSACMGEPKDSSSPGHHSFKSHLRIVEWLWEKWIGPIVVCRSLVWVAHIVDRAGI